MVVHVHGRNLGVQHTDDVRTQCLCDAVADVQLVRVQLAHELEPRLEQALAQRVAACSLRVSASS